MDHSLYSYHTMNAIQTAEELCKSAAERTGLDDFGDPRFLEALDELLTSIRAEASLTPEGAAAASERFLRLLVNRLRIEAAFSEHPEISNEPVAPPLIICGLPRVGSTKLHRLLAESGDFSALLFWQGFNPAPIPGDPTGSSDPRIAQAVEFLEWRSRLNPRTDAAHHMASLEPEEDTYLLEYTLHTYWPHTYYHVPGFLRWLKAQDRDHAFAYVHRLFQYLQHQFHRDRPRPWLLKSPVNFGFERELARHFPGARFVVLHRDPIEVLPSLVGIVREVRRLYSTDAGDLRIVGDWALEEYAGAMNRHMAWREHAAPGSVLDISYADVRAGHGEAIARVYRHCGMTLSLDASERMDGWSAANAQHAHGEHLYTLDESNLSVARIKQAFAAYYIKFDAYLR